MGREQQELRVIERRRRLEEERKARIFNPKQRTIGVDKYVILIQHAITLCRRISASMRV